MSAVTSRSTTPDSLRFERTTESDIGSGSDFGSSINLHSMLDSAIDLNSESEFEGAPLGNQRHSKLREIRQKLKKENRELQQKVNEENLQLRQKANKDNKGLRKFIFIVRLELLGEINQLRAEVNRNPNYHPKVAQQNQRLFLGQPKENLELKKPIDELSKKNQDLVKENQKLRQELEEFRKATEARLQKLEEEKVEPEKEASSEPSSISRNSDVPEPGTNKELESVAKESFPGSFAE